jgi:hypothetical protein
VKRETRKAKEIAESIGLSFWPFLIKGEMVVDNGLNDFLSFMENVKANLTRKPCRRKGQENCFEGICGNNCEKKKKFQLIYDKHSVDKSFNIVFSVVEQREKQFVFSKLAVPLSLNYIDYPREKRIEYLRQAYEEDMKKLPPGDQWEEDDIVDDIDERDLKGRTKFHIAVEKGDKTEIESLIKNGAKTGVVDNAGFTALQIAKLDGKKEIIEFLISLGVMK